MITPKDVEQIRRAPNANQQCSLLVLKEIKNIQIDENVIVLGFGPVDLRIYGANISKNHDLSTFEGSYLLSVSVKDYAASYGAALDTPVSREIRVETSRGEFLITCGKANGFFDCQISAEAESPKEEIQNDKDQSDLYTRLLSEVERLIAADPDVNSTESQVLSKLVDILEDYENAAFPEFRTNDSDKLKDKV